ncbi:uncharacterized protein EDB93DRAFT_102430 [Suillus bovinus]|uniref:uncharacterized protein n=1 Tax=Suillus bovinus TaxID=48563 RepID=UPI001B865AF6|nr:uncharacterized protein EDB93DRAFT_102430 [Suillus bovinus]KAG2155351.1 hypothetical protein EDB93DRAFT_102430 [Suillus bovinus]
MHFMAGMEATELIRTYEMHKGTDFYHRPHCSLIGDRERCLQVGMDDHITKPLRRGDLGMNLINKLAEELVTQYNLFYRPPALMAP